MNINDVSIARLALAQSANPADGLLTAAKAQLQLDNATAASPAADSVAAQDAVIETLQADADAAARKHVDKTA